MNSLSKLIRAEKSLYWNKKGTSGKKHWGFNMKSAKSKDPIKGYVGDGIFEQIKKRGSVKTWVNVKGIL